MEEISGTSTRSDGAPVVLQRDSCEVRAEPREPREQGSVELKRAIAALAAIRLKRPPKRFVSGISAIEELRYVFDRLVLSKNEAEFHGVLAEPFDESWRRGHPGWKDPRQEATTTTVGRDSG